MASLIDELIETLNNELTCYEQLAELSKNKTEIIVKGNVPALQEMTEREQVIASKVTRLDKKRERIISDISLVINQEAETLTLTKLIDLLKEQKNEQEQLKKLYSQLKEVITYLKEQNDKNKQLIQQSLDFIDFTMNAIRSSQSYPQTASYESKGRSAYNTYDKNMFDAKQ